MDEIILSRLEAIGIMAGVLWLCSKCPSIRAMSRLWRRKLQLWRIARDMGHSSLSGWVE